MKVMLLAAGQGQRLLPLTALTPKPLIEIQGKPIIFHLIEQLVRQGFDELVINVCYRGDQIQAALGNGQQFGAHIEYSVEKDALETGGVIVNALPLLGQEPFMAINSDILTDFPFAKLKAPHESLAHLVLVDTLIEENSKQQGDFALINGRVSLTGNKLYTYSGIAVYHPRFFDACKVERFSITPLLIENIRNRQISGEIHLGCWEDIGNLQRLEQLRKNGVAK